jgi:hypothetical protein
VGTLGVGIMNLMAFSLSPNSNSKIDGNQITFGAENFQPHPPTLTLVFEGLDHEMELTIGSLNFCIGSLGTTRLSDPINSGPLARKTAAVARSESSVGSSNEVNSSVSFTSKGKIEDTIEELDEIMENFDLGESPSHLDKGSNESSINYTITDFTTQSGGVSESDEGTWRPEGKYTTSVHQMCVIITEAAEDDDGRNNPVIDSQGDNLGNTHMKEREKIYVSPGEWKMIKSAVNHGTIVPADSRREVLMGYQYALHQHKKQLLREESKLRRNYESNSAENKTQWEECSDTSQTS